VVGDDITPTSLNEGRGNVVVFEPVVMFHLGLECQMAVGCSCGGHSR
jgi:hypothetical protein